MKLLDRIANLCGDEVAIFLTIRFTGMRFRIPEHLEESHPIAELGDAGEMLCYYFGGDRVVIGRWIPDSLIEARLRSGVSIDAIATELRLNRRTIYRRIQLKSSKVQQSQVKSNG